MAHPTDFSQTQRIVLLIDLHPLLHLPNPSAYLTPILSSAQILLSFPPLSSSLFAFKLFFSSLSPLLSSSKLHSLLGKSAASLSFHHPPHTLSSLTHTLKSLSALCHSNNSADSVVSPPRASLTASSLLQLVHDYAWDPLIHDPLGKLNNSPVVRSNLVLLLSPTALSLKGLSEFISVDLDDELLTNVDAFCNKFLELFGSVNEAFVSRDIHCSWIDVKCELECDEEKVEIDESVLKLGLLENGIKSFGWGFCSTESIILGSALVPFGLIYPKVGVLSNCLNVNDCCQAIRAQLSLEISDVNGKPLECKCCDLDLINLKMLPRPGYDDVLHNTREFIGSETSGCEQKKTFWGQFGDGVTNLRVRAVQRYDTCIKIEGCLPDVILVRGSLAEAGKERNESSTDFFPDRLLEMLSTEMSEFMQRKAIPIWQILLSFLHRQGYWALVSLSNGNGNSCTGILKPFTVHLALISIIENGFHPQNMTDCLGGQNLIQFAKRTNEVCMPNVDVDHSNEFIDSQSGISSLKQGTVGDGKRKKVKKHSHLRKDLSWSSFRKEAFGHCEMVLEEVYFARGCNNSKKLKFFRCWIKQIKKSGCCWLTIPNGSQPHQDIPKEIKERLPGLNQQSERTVSSSVSAGEDLLTGTSGIHEGAALLSCLETLEAFFRSLPEKIQHALESEGVDLGALAERLVNTSIHLLYQKHETDADSENQAPVVESDNICSQIVAEVTKLILMEPKDLAAKHRYNDTPLQASDQRSTKLASEKKVREYELQIFFRMEILRSEFAVSIEESTKQKFVKQICSLLETIQCHLEGGFFGDTSLDDYVGRTLKNRYSHTLGDVVHKIYRKMDLLLFGDEDDSPNPLLNSEDSNQSWRDKLQREERGENDGINEPVSAEDESSKQLENAYRSSQAFKSEEHARRLIEAQERRERARRFASFTSWVPDLQRVWAPKQPKAMKAKLDPLQKLSKRKQRQRASYDMVCETPMTGKKRSCRQECSIGTEEPEVTGINSSGSVSKALFQDTDEWRTGEAIDIT